ncbi:MAG: hypothetical protein NZ519_01165 [Bacteroidia bacterium]|nr:hypothetical protein [Bacteroidia bacterium]MDW8301167.1 hypothetical protein [Bacteroidia bacterium]
MKKILVACAFVICTFVFVNVANAQCCGGKKSASNCPSKAKTEVSAANNVDNTQPDAKAVNSTEEKDKKCCSSKASKNKSCCNDKATASSKKECCSSKKEARKEESK